jgi:hypothetical protein
MPVKQEVLEDASEILSIATFPNTNTDHLLCDFFFHSDFLHINLWVTNASLSQARWHVSIIPATWEAEAGGFFEHRRPSWTT